LADQKNAENNLESEINFQNLMNVISCFVANLLYFTKNHPNANEIKLLLFSVQKDLEILFEKKFDAENLPQKILAKIDEIKILNFNLPKNLKQKIENAIEIVFSEFKTENSDEKISAITENLQIIQRFLLKMDAGVERKNANEQIAKIVAMGEFLK